MGMIYGDVLDGLSKIESNSIDTVISSPPYYGLRDYGKEGQWGLEETPELYLLHMTRFMDQINRVLKDSGTCWINLGDTYAGSGKGAWKEKNKSKETPETIPDKRYKLKEDVPRKILKKVTSKNINIIYLKESDHQLSSDSDLKFIIQSIEYIQNLKK